MQLWEVLAGEVGLWMWMGIQGQGLGHSPNWFVVAVCMPHPIGGVFGSQLAVLSCSWQFAGVGQLRAHIRFNWFLINHLHLLRATVHVWMFSRVHLICFGSMLHVSPSSMSPMWHSTRCKGVGFSYLLSHL